MDGCSLSDAFPEGPSAGCTDTVASHKQRKQEAKKAKKCRGPQSWYVSSDFPLGPYAKNTDPDRPAVKRMESVPSLNSKTGLKEHAPVDQDWGYESFVGGQGCLPELRKTVASATKLQSSGTPAPSFFGANPSDDSTLKRGLAEGFVSGGTSGMNPAGFVNIIGNDESYRLEPDFGQLGALKGYDVAQNTPVVLGPSDIEHETAYLTPTTMQPGTVLPTPNVDTFWRKSPLSGGQTSFFEQLRAPGGLPSGPEPNEAVSSSSSSQDMKTMSQKLDRIFARLDDMENASADSAQTEVLLFIMTGLGVIFLMDLACRTAGK